MSWHNATLQVKEKGVLVGIAGTQLAEGCRARQPRINVRISGTLRYI